MSDQSCYVYALKDPWTSPVMPICDNRDLRDSKSFAQRLRERPLQSPLDRDRLLAFPRFELQVAAVKERCGFAALRLGEAAHEEVDADTAFAVVA